MFRKFFYRIQKRREQKEIVSACGGKRPEGLVTFGKVSARWGIHLKIGKNVSLGEDVVFYGEGTIVLGDDVFINHGTMIYAYKNSTITIGNGTAIAPYCFIINADHLIKKDLPIRSQGFAIDDVTIGSDCWLGAHVCVLKGSSIRDGAVIGAGAVVKGLIPENAVAVGVPAKVIKQRE